MSQNGPAQPPAGRSADGYSEPTDPWDGLDTWGGQSASGQGLSGQGFDGGPVWDSPAPPRRRGPGMTTIVLLSVVGLLLVGGAAVGVYLFTERDRTEPAREVAASVPAAPSSVPQDPADARFVVAGQCVRNDGSEDVPRMRVVACTPGTFEVLKRIDGTTSGEKDAQLKCAKVGQYTNWFFYDSELDGLDFVLCLRAH
jgi:hypothetical protein